MLQETERYAKPDSALLRGLRDSVLEREKSPPCGGKSAAANPPCGSMAW